MGSVGKRNSVVMAELDDEVCRPSLCYCTTPHRTALHSTALRIRVSDRGMFGLTRCH